MPTYSYPYASKVGRKIVIRNASGKLEEIEPGNLAFESDTFYSVGTGGVFSMLTKTLDTPYYNPILAVTNVAAAGTITLNADTELVIISDISGTGLVFMESADNTPGQALDGLGMMTLVVNDHFQKLVFTTTGVINCKVTEYKTTTIVSVI